MVSGDPEVLVEQLRRPARPRPTTNRRRVSWGYPVPCAMPRVAITSEDPTAKANPEFVAAMHSLAS